MPELVILHVCPHCERVFDSPSTCAESGEQTVPTPMVVAKQQFEQLRGTAADEEQRYPNLDNAVALPLATRDSTRCTHRRDNGHRCALPIAHATEHFYREDGVRWRGDIRSAVDEERHDG